MTLCVDAIRGALDGAIPATLATCSADGIPNISFVSQVYYVDPDHVALSFQFFNKTRENVLATRRAAALVIDPVTFARYRIALEYLRLETGGPLYERMKAHLAGIASHTGMAAVFRLRGADVYRVLGIEQVAGHTLPGAAPQRHHLAAVRKIAQRIAACADLSNLLDEALAALDECLGVRYAMILMADVRAGKLYTVASRGYAASGVGSEIAFGEGVIGVAAREMTPIRIMHRASEWGYGRAIRESAAEGGMGSLLETEIPVPGLAESRSQLAVPVVAGSSLSAILFVEDVRDRRFGFDDEDALVAVAALLGPTIRGMQELAESAADAATARDEATPVHGAPLTVRHYRADDSVFLGDDYLIKGVAGAIFCKLLRDYTRDGRTEFTNRELRLDPSIRLPDITDNLEARLILLQRRIAERASFLALEKTGRGRFRFCVRRPVQLVEMQAGSGR
ncbi:MAG: GAF domain-containing protein [Casimicrobiaceae bacterium]